MPCLSPNRLSDGTEAACRECKQCQLTARNMWVGRNIAESKTSKFCYWITGTYGRGRVGESLHERAVILTYSDCQKFLKLLRRHGYRVRFFITGEYGAERGRAHWNIILYSNEPLPPFSGWDRFGRWKDKVPYENSFNWVRTDSAGKPVYLQDGSPAYWWPHGFVYVDELNYKNIKYVCKYVLKDFDGNGRQGHKGQSKDPPIGTQWFLELAERYVVQGLAPQTPEYRHPEVKTREGDIVRFWMRGRVLELFLQRYIDAWAERYPDRPRPRSEYVDLFEQYGKVVNDEAAMVARQEFPRGESRAPIPTAQQIKVGAEEARYERAVSEYVHGVEKLNNADMRYIEGNESEQGPSRQRVVERRQQFVERQRAQNWKRFNHAWGRHAYADGWKLRTDRTEPCACCGPDLGQPMVGGRAEFEPDDRRSQPDYGVGPVGKYNRYYGAGPGAQRGAGDSDNGSET